MSDLLEQALHYAQNAGWLIHPCKPDKTPYLKAWQEKATTDPEQIKSWWSKWPEALIGCATGQMSGIWVLDADLPDGPDELEQMNLPSTLKQQTGSGGLQVFFSWNGHNIRNSARKLGKCLDVRGNGGYVVLPPSLHPSGNRYKWLVKAKPCPAPEWLSQKAAKPEKTEQRTISGPNSPYGLSALSQEIIRLSGQAEGSRNETLNQCAYSLGQLVAGGELDENHVVNALMSTALTIGLNEAEADKTIKSGLESGKEHPRSGNEFNRTNETNDSNDSNGTTNFQRSLTVTNGTNAPVSGTNARFQGNLTAEIRQFIQENQGSFTSADIDREFGLHHPSDKNLRRWALNKIKKENYIKNDRRVSGKFHIIKEDIEWISSKNISDKYFPLTLPLSLEEVVRIPPKCICVVAGTSNAGKTAFLLEIAKMNMHQKYDIMYLMSEMGPSEYLQRVNKVTDNIAEWEEKIKSASMSSGFDGPITHHNRCGLTLIDFLEDVQGEYYKIPSDIRTIYDALDTGVAWIALQKHSQARVGRGGEGTTEKARLYLTIDVLAHKPRHTVSAIKIIKAKDYQGDNPNGKEIHVKIVAGSRIEPITGWMYCNENQRKQYVQQYENQIEEGAPLEQAVYFTTMSGQKKRIRGKDIKAWQEAFKHIDVESELLRISEQSDSRPFLKDKDYFFQLAGLLKNANDKNIDSEEAPF
jgi:hypothetical protein